MKSHAFKGMLALGAVLSFWSVRAEDLPAPYHDMQNNVVYNALFCDSEGLVKPKDAASATPWQRTLFAAAPDAGAVRSVAEDTKESSCVRLLAYKWLREHSQLVPPRQLLGVVIEVPVDEGLDTLAAYADGHVRFISHADKLSVVDAPPAAVQDKTRVLFASSNKLLSRIGVWNKKRLPAPIKGKVRMSFLGSDGLYFGEGSFAAIQKDADATQVIKDGTGLLQLVVDMQKSATNPGQ
ncbi:MAG TPA: hypothetical protein VF798_17610 [Burkholderiaceae bacterium]